MNTYRVKQYNLNLNTESTVDVEAESAFDALCVAGAQIPRNVDVPTTSHRMLDVWAKLTDNPELAASDNRHWQRNRDTGTIGAQAWRIA